MTVGIRLKVDESIGLEVDVVKSERVFTLMLNLTVCGVREARLVKHEIYTVPGAPLVCLTRLQTTNLMALCGYHSTDRGLSVRNAWRCMHASSRDV